jgi:3'(2'), 5'-bisphosphate nucleotidase
VTSRSHLDDRTRAWAAACPGADTHPSGSSLKFCLLAEGVADAYPRFGPTSEWDTAAADAVLRAAGGLTWGTDGAPLGYGKTRYLNGAFLALGDPDAAPHLPPFPD